jgi:hypothetical protein
MKDKSFTIEPATCGDGFHIKHEGRTVRQEDRKPLLFPTHEAALGYVDTAQGLPLFCTAEASTFPSHQLTPQASNKD